MSLPSDHKNLWNPSLYGSNFGRKKAGLGDEPDLEYCSLAGRLKMRSATRRVLEATWYQATSFFEKPVKKTALIW